jgi:hypothetical protein
MAILSFKLDQLFILLVPDLVVVVVVVVVVGVRSPSEPDFVQKYLPIMSNFVLLMIVPLRTDPHPQRLVLLVLDWHRAMAILSFKLDQLFILLVPELVVLVEVVVTFTFPSEPDFVQNYLSIESKFVILMIFPLRIDPLPESLVLLVTLWHHTMSILSFKLDKLLIFHIPLLSKCRHGYARNSQGNFIMVPLLWMSGC